MIEPKPLSNEEREIMVNDHYASSRWAVLTLLAAEAFWRNAVKNAEWYHHGKCWFCDAYRHVKEGFPHKPDCAWLLAQDKTLHE